MPSAFTPIGQFRNRGLAVLVLLVAATLGGPCQVYGEPPGTVTTPSEPDPTFRSELLTNIADDTRLPPLWLNREELLAYDKLVLHAREMPSDLLRRAARRDVTFADLFGEERGKYRGQLIHIDGRLKLLRRLDLPSTLEGLADGLNELYEGWILDRPSEAHYCVVVSELPPDLKPAEEMDRPVECNAYFFKRYEYPTRERANGGGNVRRLAPLLIGKTIRPKAQPAAGASLWVLPAGVLAGTIGLVALGLGVGVAVVWWFRREDRRIRARLRQARPDPAVGADADLPWLADRGPMDIRPSGN
jgi:hypothetical protein